MPKIIILPYSHIENICQDAVHFANSFQSDFSFYLIPPVNIKNTPLTKTSSDYTDILNYLDGLKNKYNYETNDLIITFFNGTLSAVNHGLTNLFIAGTNYREKPSCCCVISLKYLDWGILEEKYNYEIQKHSILHLIICSIIGAYTDLKAHTETYGCLMDRNDQLFSFNKKLQKGYYLCSMNEANCYQKIKAEKYGNSIKKLCDNFKNSNNFRTIIKEIVMGDKFENIFNSTIINKSNFENALNNVKDDKELVEVINQLKELIEKSGNKEASEAFNDFNEELSKVEPKKSKLKAYWNSLTVSLPTILTMVNITEKIVKLF